MPPASAWLPEVITRRRVALIGMPNTGKSTFFNRLTGAHARTGNWPGVTVDLLSSRLIVGDGVVEFVDLPGIYDLSGFSDDEKVVRDFLHLNAIDAALIIVNSVQAERQLHIAAQVRRLGIPAILLMNMQDEAAQLGIRINREALSAALEMPVVMVSAKLGQGMPDVLPALQTVFSLETRQPLPDLEDRLQAIGPQTAWVAELSRCIQIPTELPPQLTERLDRVLLSPVWGLPIFFAIMATLFQAIYMIGQPLQNGVAWLLGSIKTLALVPLLAPLPAWLSGFLLDGAWDGLSTVATFVPIVVVFFLFMALVEDTGYFSRAAYLMDAFMGRLGLDGRGFVMMLMGYGCNVPALMGTRIMRNRALRMLTMLIIPFSLCSARLQVFLFLITILFPAKVAGLVLFSLYLVSMAIAVMTALIFKRWYPAREPLILEIPPFRLPTLRMLWLRGWQEVRHFLRRATRMILAGVVLVWLLTHLPWGVAVAGTDSFAGMLGTLFQPVLAPLGIDPRLTVALIFGFVAKEIVVGALAVIYGLEGNALAEYIRLDLTLIQAYSFMLFTLIYTPCLSTIATLWAETRSKAFTALALIWPLSLAWLVSWTFYQVATRLAG